MNKRRLRSNRFLPEYVSRYKDRHGRWRYRFRRKGYPSGHFTAALGTEEFREEYARFMDAAAPGIAAEKGRSARALPGTVGELKHRYFATPERLGPTETTRIKVRAVLERGFFNGREDWPLAGIGFEHIDALIARRRQKVQDEKGKWVGGIEAARKLRKELVRLFDFAEAAGLVAKSPMKHVAQVKVAPSERSSGFYSWTEDDIAQYRAHWKLGTKQRLAMELMLWTDQRKVDSIHLGRQHIKGGQVPHPPVEDWQDAGAADRAAAQDCDRRHAAQRRHVFSCDRVGQALQRQGVWQLVPRHVRPGRIAQVYLARPSKGHDAPHGGDRNAQCQYEVGQRPQQGR